MLKLNKEASIEKLEAIPFNQAILSYAKKKYKPLRQESKKVSFALQYGGTEHTLVENCGFSKEEALKLLQNYKKLYAVSEQNKQYFINKATEEGYAIGAFGLRVRTPLLKQVLHDKRITPREAESEARTMSNARFQSYCLLTTRAGVEFHKRTREEGYASKIIPINQIHDALYFLVKNDADTILWLNKWLVKAVQWQDDPAIYHDKVKLGGNLSIFYPDWANEYEIPNECTKEQLFEICKGDK